MVIANVHEKIRDGRLVDEAALRFALNAIEGLRREIEALRCALESGVTPVPQVLKDPVARQHQFACQIHKLVKQADIHANAGLGKWDQRKQQGFSGRIPIRLVRAGRVDHLFLRQARSLMQTINVLGDDRRHLARRHQGGKA